MSLTSGGNDDNGKAPHLPLQSGITCSGDLEQLLSNGTVQSQHSNQINPDRRHPPLSFSSPLSRLLDKSAKQKGGGKKGGEQRAKAGDTKKPYNHNTGSNSRNMHCMCSPNNSSSHSQRCTTPPRRWSTRRRVSCSCCRCCRCLCCPAEAPGARPAGLLRLFLGWEMGRRERKGGL